MCGVNDNNYQGKNRWFYRIIDKLEYGKYQQSNRSTLILFSSSGVCLYGFCSYFDDSQYLFTVHLVSFNYCLYVHDPMICIRNQKTCTVRLSGSHVNSRYGCINKINHSNKITSTDTYIHLIIF